MSFDVSLAVNTIYAVLAAGLLIGAAAAALQMGISAWHWLAESTQVRGERYAREQDEMDNRRHGY